MINDFLKNMFLDIEDHFVKYKILTKAKYERIKAKRDLQFRELLREQDKEWE